MTVITPVKHVIQQYIIDQLSRLEVARFSDLRPPKTDTNLFAYHLKVLVGHGLVEKADDGYRLGLAGLSYARDAGIDTKSQFRAQIVTMLVIQNSDGGLLLQKRAEQPFINTWELPSAQPAVDDVTIAASAQSIASAISEIVPVELRHAGEAYIRVYGRGDLLMTTLAHIYRFESDNIKTDDSLVWASPHALGHYSLAPGVESIVARSFFNDDCFFEEYNEDWS